jgi:hypothetical protein
MRRILSALVICGICICSSPAESETRNYTKSGPSRTTPVNNRQLELQLDQAFNRTGHTVVSGIQPLLIIVSHPQLTAADDSLVNQTINAYVYDPLFDTRLDANSAVGDSTQALTMEMRAIMIVTVQQLNIIRAKVGLPDITQNDFFLAVRQAINQGTAD